MSLAAPSRAAARAGSSSGNGRCCHDGPVDADLVAVGAADKPVIAALLQLYLHDFSEFEPRELTAHGTFDYPWLDSYFTAPEREAYLITVAGHPAGFALARCDVDGSEGDWNVSEFFVVRRHRRQGVAERAARLLFARHMGPWTLSFLVGNVPAARFWPRVVEAVATGPVVRRDLPRTEGANPKVRLWFEVGTSSEA